MQIQGTSFEAYGSSELEAAENLQRKILQSGKLQPDSSTFKSFTETSYLMTLEGKSATWQRQNRWAMNHCKTFMNLPVAEITRDMLQATLNTMRRKGLSRVSIGHWRRIVWSILNLAEADGLIQSNPMKFVKLPPQNAKEMAQVSRHLTAQELRALIELAADRKSSALPTIVLGGLLGLGYEEIRNLTPKCFSRGVLQVPGTKNAYRNRSLPLPAKVVELLADRHFPLIPKSDSSTIKAISRVSERLGLGRVGRHILRHTAATGLQELGCPIEARELILGHSNKSMSAHYSHGQMMELKTRWVSAWIETVFNQEQIGRKTI